MLLLPSSPPPPHTPSSFSGPAAGLDTFVLLETRVKLWVTTAAYELLHGSAGTRRAVDAAEKQGSAAARVEAKADAIKYNAALKFIEHTSKSLNPYVQVSFPAPGSNPSAPAPLASAPLGPSVQAAAAFFKWMTIKSQLAALTTGDKNGANPSGGAVSAALAGVSEESVAARWGDFVVAVRTIGDTVKRNAPVGAVTGAVPHALGEALVAWHAGNVIVARARFADVITLHPGCGAGPRVGLALCLLRLGHIDPAALALKRALEVEPNHAAALAAHAFVESHGAALRCSGEDAIMGGVPEEDAGALARGASLAKRALQIEPDNAQALVLLSHAYFSTWADVVARESGASVTVVATRGSRTLVLSDASVLARFRAGEWLKVSTTVKGRVLLVPVRLAAVDATAMVPDASHLGLVNDAVPSSGPLGILKMRAPWGAPSAGGLPLKALDVGLAEKQARQAVLCTRSDDQRGEAYFCLGRALHAGGNHIDAALAYKSALRGNKDHVAALTGLAQCEARAEKEDEAARLLARVLTLRPDDRTALKILAALSAKRGAIDEATDYARRAAELAPRDATIGALYASLLQRGVGRIAAERALRAAEAVSKTLRERGSAVPIALSCNIGVLRCRLAAYKVGKERATELAAADEQFQIALVAVAMELLPGAPQETLTSAEVRERASLSPLGVTVGFNIARLRELQGRLAEAAAAFQAIATAFPAYLDAHVRLALLARTRGDVAAASAHLADVVAAAADAPSRSAVVSALVLQGQLKEASGDRAGAREKYKAALREPGFAKDPYAALSVANTDFAEIFALDEAADAAVAGGGATSAREEVLRRAFEAYKDVLKASPANVFAANGLGAVLAEQGRLDHARDVFALVREASGQECVPVHMNLAHTLVALKQPDAAAQIFSQTLRRFGGGRGAGTSAAAEGAGGGGALATAAGAPADQVKVLVYLARALLEGKRHVEAARALSRALILVPADLTVTYNLGWVLLSAAYKVGADYTQEARALADATASGGAAAAAALTRRTVGVAELEMAAGHVREADALFRFVVSRLAATKAELNAAEEAASRLAADAAATPSDVAAALAHVARLSSWIDSLGFSEEQAASFLKRINDDQTVVKVDGMLANARATAVRAKAEIDSRAAAAAARAKGALAEGKSAADVAAALQTERLAKAAALKALLAEKQVEWATEAALSASTSRKGGKASSKQGGAGRPSDDSSDEEAGGGGGGGGGGASSSSPIPGESEAQAMKDLFGDDESSVSSLSSDDEGGGGGGGASASAKNVGELADAALDDNFDLFGDDADTTTAAPATTGAGAVAGTSIDDVEQMALSAASAAVARKRKMGVIEDDDDEEEEEGGDTAKRAK